MQRCSARYFAAVVGLLLATTAALLAAENIGIFQGHKDVGHIAKKGKVIYGPVNGTYRVTGGGANIWGQTDAFQYVFRKVSGDVSLAADIDFVGKGIEAHRKAALMIRQSLAPDSAYVDIALHGDGLAALQFRPFNGAMTQEVRSDVKAPVRVSIERHGNQFIAGAGESGGTLQSVVPVTVAMQDPVYVGLAISSHNADALETALFSNVVFKEVPQAKTK